MHCSLSRELVSADLDGELAADERWLLNHHLDACGQCRRYAAQATELHRALRVQPAPPVPDLTAAVLAVAGDAPPVRRSALGWRIGLAAVGLLQLLLAGPALVQHPDATAEQQAIHHLDAFTVAFAVGLLVVAWQPWRVRGVLPIATTLAGVMLFTVVLDVHNDHSIGMPLTAHGLELAGLVLAWGLARHDRRNGGDPGEGDRRRPGQRRPTFPLVAGWLRPGRNPGAWARTAPPATAGRSDRPDRSERAA